MSPPGRPKGGYRSAQHEGTPVSTTATTGVLVLVDPTASGRHAAWRGAVVARELALPLCLLYARPTAALLDAGEGAVRQLAADIGDHFGLHVRVEVAGGDALAAAVRTARAAALVVIGSQRAIPCASSCSARRPSG
jgi:hypothetical protein